MPLYYGTNQVGIGWNAMIAMWNGDNQPMELTSAADETLHLAKEVGEGSLFNGIVAICLRFRAQTA